MTSEFDDTGTAQGRTSQTANSETDDPSTGLPGLRTWPLVYLVVAASFAIWVVLLLALEGFFS